MRLTIGNRTDLNALVNEIAEREALITEARKPTLLRLLQRMQLPRAAVGGRLPDH